MLLWQFYSVSEDTGELRGMVVVVVRGGMGRGVSESIAMSDTDHAFFLFFLKTNISNNFVDLFG